VPLENRQHVNASLADAVYDPVGAEEDLANVIMLELGDNPTSVGQTSGLSRSRS
jgi:hypothetical protein